MVRFDVANHIPIIQSPPIGKKKGLGTTIFRKSSRVRCTPFFRFSLLFTGYVGYSRTDLLRRASVSYFGCAIVSRNHVSGVTGIGSSVKDAPVAHLLCVYAFEKKSELEPTSLASPKSPCRVTFPVRARNTSGTGDFLCRSKYLFCKSDNAALEKKVPSIFLGFLLIYFFFTL